MPTLELTRQEESDLLSLCDAAAVGNGSNVAAATSAAKLPELPQPSSSTLAMPSSTTTSSSTATTDNNDNTTKKRRPKPRKSEIHAKKNVRSLSESELLVEFDKYLLSIANEETCYNQSGGGYGSCTCLHILRKPHLRAAVAKYKLNLTKKTKHEIDTMIFEWYRYAKACADEKSGRHKPLYFMIPFDGTDALAKNIDIREIVTARMCQQALYRVMGITEFRFTSIKQCAITGVVPRHASTGKKSHNSMSDDNRAILVGHFNELVQFAMGEASSSSTTTTRRASSSDGGGVADIQLPLPYSARHCYRIYLKAMGYSSTYNSNGAVNVTWDGNEEDTKPKYMSATTYYSVWKQDFPHLKVSLGGLLRYDNKQDYSNVLHSM